MAGKVKMLQAWLKQQCQGYRDVEIKDMSKSWKSGLAFCAIIHKYRPDLIDYDSLSKENVYDNNKLAFETAKELGIPALLDAEDMVAMAVPDKLCIITYVSQYYNYFRDKEPKGGPGVSAKRAPKRAPATSTASPQPDRKKVAGDDTDNMGGGKLKRQGTYGETCLICDKKVYLLERHIDNGRLFHRRCFHSSQRGRSMSPRSSSSSIEDVNKVNMSPSASRSSSPYLSRRHVPNGGKSITDVLKESKANSNSVTSNDGTQSWQLRNNDKNGRALNKPLTKSPLAAEPVSDNTRSAQKSWQILNQLDNDDSPMREAKSSTAKCDLSPTKYTATAKPWQALDNSGQESLIQISQKPWQSPVSSSSSPITQLSSPHTSVIGSNLGMVKANATSDISSGAGKSESRDSDVNMQPSRNFTSTTKAEITADRNADSKKVAAREGLSKLLGKEMLKKEATPIINYMETDSNSNAVNTGDQKNQRQIKSAPRSILKTNNNTVAIVKEPPKEDAVKHKAYTSQAVIKETPSTWEEKFKVNGVGHKVGKEHVGQKLTDGGKKDSAISLAGQVRPTIETERDSDRTFVSKVRTDVNHETTAPVHKLKQPARPDHGPSSHTSSGIKNSALGSSVADKNNVSHVNMFEADKSNLSNENVGKLRSGSSGASHDMKKDVDKPKTGGRTIVPRKTPADSVPPSFDQKEKMRVSNSAKQSSDNGGVAASRLRSDMVQPAKPKRNAGQSAGGGSDSLHKTGAEKDIKHTANAKSDIRSRYLPETFEDRKKESRQIQKLKSPVNSDSKTVNSSSRRHSADLLSSKNDKPEQIAVSSECKPDPKSPESVELHSKLFGPLSDFQNRYRRKSADDILEDISKSSAHMGNGTPEKPRRKIKEKTNELPFQVNLKPVPKTSVNHAQEEPMDVDVAPKSAVVNDSPHFILKKRERSRTAGSLGDSQVESKSILKKPSSQEPQPMDTSPSQNRPKSILKKTSASDSPESGGFFGLIKRTWNKSMENLTSPTSPRKDGDSSPRLKLSVEFDENRNPNRTAVSNNMSAFNLMDSVDLALTSTLDKRLGTTNDSQDLRKKAWHTEINKKKEHERRMGVTEPPSASETNSKPDWMLEAERRKEMRRKSGFEDPELKKADSHVENQDGKARKNELRVTITKPQVSESWKVEDKQSKVCKDNANKAESARGDEIRTNSREGESKPEWMLEAERRKVARKGVYVDPELQQHKAPVDSDNLKPDEVNANGKLPGSPRPPRPAFSPSSVPKIKVLKPGDDQKHPSSSSRQPRRIGDVDDTISSLEVTEADLAKARVLRKPNRPPPPRPPASPVLQEHIRKKIELDQSFHFSIDSTASEIPPLPPRSPMPSADLSPELPPRRYREEFVPSGTMDRQGISNLVGRPLPPLPPPSPESYMEPEMEPEIEPTRRKVNAEEPIPEMSILEQLQQIGGQLDHLEEQGRILEEKIRSETTEDEAMDDGDLMVMWFELINKKNELVRADADLMYRQKQQQYESQHEETEYELRCLMAIPSDEKSTSEKIREEALLQQLIETVSLRNSIVDNMEEDRLRYIQEDQEIADMMFAKGFSKEEPAAPVKGNEKKKVKPVKEKEKKKKKKKNSK